MTKLLDTGNDLVRARRAQGVSQRALGERLGVRQQQVARWEASGYRGAGLERVDAVARVLGVDLAGSPTSGLPLAVEAPAIYGAGGDGTPGVPPVRDLGEIAARIRANGETLSSRYHLDRIGVFGSFVYGEQAPESDVDLLVETADPGGFRFVEAADYAEQILGREVDFVRPHLLKERLRDRVLREAVYVWSA